VNRERFAAGLGVAAAALALVLTAVPYAVTGPTAISAYYSVGLVSPVFVSLLSVVGAITLLSAAKRRSDPALAAGIAVTVAAFAVVLALLWAVPAHEVALSIDLRGGSAFGVDATAWFAYHPYSVVLATLVLVGAAGLYVEDVL